MDDYDYCEKVGTLCDHSDSVGLTCSMAAAKDWGQAKQLNKFVTFEDAIAALKQDRVTAVLIPSAYPYFGKFIMDSALMVHTVFLYKIPDLVLVGAFLKEPPKVDILYHHPATGPLLTEVPIIFATSEHVSSNSQACTSLMENAEHSVAITNRLCAEYFNLSIYKVLRTGIIMPFVIFRKA